MCVREQSGHVTVIPVIIAQRGKGAFPVYISDFRKLDACSTFLTRDSMNLLLNLSQRKKEKKGFVLYSCDKCLIITFSQ